MSARFPASRVAVYPDTAYLWLVEIRHKLAQCIFAVQCADCWIISTSWDANSIRSLLRSRPARKAESELTMAAMLEVIRAVPGAGEVRRFGRAEYEDRWRRR